MNRKIKPTTDRTFRTFCTDVEALLSGTAGAKGYSGGSPDGPNQLYAFVAELVGGPQHAAGETVYKIQRYLKKGNPEDLLKAAAWCFLMWRHHR
jgi:hypothetical protein